MKHVRRGAAVAVAVVMLAVINFAVVGAVVASGDEAKAGAMRIETSRALYAAESGARIVLKVSASGGMLPATGSSVPVGDANAEFVSLPGAGQAGDAVIQGRSGTAGRRLKVSVAAQ